MSLIAVVDYGMGNLRSVARAVEHVSQPGQKVKITSSAADIVAADRVIFPGQGAARECMFELSSQELIQPVLEASRTRPFLGICMGLQILMSHSEENDGIDCMNIFQGEVSCFADSPDFKKSDESLKIPHMGWNNVYQKRKHPLWKGIENNSRYYFVHSYFVKPENQEFVAGETNYGIGFTSVLANENIFAVQFHPEKSATAGLRLLENFTTWDGNG